jgi:hypothetical protein
MARSWRYLPRHRRRQVRCGCWWPPSQRDDLNGADDVMVDLDTHAVLMDVLRKFDELNR